MGGRQVSQPQLKEGEEPPFFKKELLESGILVAPGRSLSLAGLLFGFLVGARGSA